MVTFYFTISNIETILANEKGIEAVCRFLYLCQVSSKSKESLCTEKCLALFEPNRQMIVSADASAYGLGAELRQKQPNGSL